MKNENIITTFKEFARKNMKSVSAAVRLINDQCFAAITPSNLDKMEQGTRRIPERVHRFMLAAVMPSELASFQSTEVLVKRLSPPLRVKK